MQNSKFKITIQNSKLILALIILQVFVIRPSKLLAASLTKTSVNDWQSGKYEWNEINIATSSGDLKLQLDLGTFDATNPAYPVHYTYVNTKMLKVGKFLYLFRNRALGQFLRYDTETREWKELGFTPVGLYESVDATTNGTDTIWAFATRSGRRHFLKYYIPTNSFPPTAGPF